MALAESLLPPEIAENYMKTIKINYSTHDADYICIGITA